MRKKKTNQIDKKSLSKYPKRQSQVSFKKNKFSLSPNIATLKELLRMPYSVLFFLWVFLYTLLNYVLNELGTVGLSIFNYAKYIWIPYVIFTIINSVLVGISINLIIIRFKNLNNMGIGGTGISAIGTFIALLAGACPGCIAGFFPIIMGLIGSSVTLIQLPFNGLEIQVFSAVLLMIGIYMLSKPITCGIKKY